MSTAASTSPDIDQLLDGRYRVEEPLARGGMATVFRGRDERLDRVVALKIMHPHLADDEDFRRRFGREARAAARLAHRHVVGVFDQGADGDRIYLAMELIDGPTLRSRIHQQGMSIRETLRIIEEVLEALRAAHAAGIVHRDIKPENILLDAEGSVKVTDFGLARAIGTANSSASATLLGTVAYISPEVVTRGQSDERSDLYSLGVVLFEMLTGSQPFRGEQPVHIAFQHVHDDIPAPSRSSRGVPKELDSLVTWASARSVEQRPVSAQEMLQAVRDLQHSLAPAVLDTVPTPHELTTTGEVAAPTMQLEEALAEVSADARAFPPHLRPGADDAAAGDSADDAEETRLPAEGADGEASGSGPSALEHAAQDEGDAAEDGVDAADGETGSPAEGDDSENADAEDQLGAPRTVTMRAPKPRRGRHLPLESRHRSRPVGLVAVGALVAALGTGAWSGADWYTNIGPGADRTVPVVAGTELDDAEQALGAADLGTRTLEQYDETVPAGHVISSSPATGETVKKGTPVQLVVSRGEELFAVPDLTGADLEDARTQVEDLGLVLVEDDPEYSGSVPAGQIISQTQSADSLPAGGEVHVVVSQGPRPLTIEDQTGRPEDAARSALEDAGFTVTTSTAHSPSVPSGSVISQSPASGKGYRGDTVNLVISQGPEMVTVPDVFQQPEADARAQLEGAGFAVEVTYQNGAPVFGLVSQQSAPAGSEQAKGTTITLTVF